VKRHFGHGDQPFWNVDSGALGPGCLPNGR
jgi:hypothetical protein